MAKLKKFVAGIAAAAAVPVALAGAGTAHANPLGVNPGAALRRHLDRLERRQRGHLVHLHLRLVHHAGLPELRRRGGLLRAGHHQPFWDINVNCDNGDTGFYPAYYY